MSNRYAAIKYPIVRWEMPEGQDGAQPVTELDEFAGLPKRAKKLVSLLGKTAGDLTSFETDNWQNQVLQHEGMGNVSLRIVFEWLVDLGWRPITKDNSKSP